MQAAEDRYLEVYAGEGVHQSWGNEKLVRASQRQVEVAG